MSPAPLDPAEHVRLLRQQLILAQVRVMEIEDDRDATHAKVQELERLLSDAHQLADAKLDETAHLTRTLEALQKEFQHLRHIQHVTHQALEETRGALARAESSLSGESAARQAAERAHAATSAGLAAREKDLRELEATAAEHVARIDTLGAELRALQSSRSWRWTAWLRALGFK